MNRCKACGQMVEDSSGRHRYGCIGPSTWSGLLEGFAHFHNCHCGKEAKIQISRGLMDHYACSAEHARSRKNARTASANPFGLFVTACMKR